MSKKPIAEKRVNASKEPSFSKRAIKDKEPISIKRAMPQEETTVVKRKNKRRKTPIYKEQETKTMTIKNMEGQEVDANGFQAALEEIKRTLPYMQEYFQIQAELHWKKFNALKEQGFTDEQALELTKSIYS